MDASIVEAPGAAADAGMLIPIPILLLLHFMVYICVLNNAAGVT